MRNIMLIIEYDGTQYSGWQRQNHVLSVEEAVEKTIIKVLNEEIKVLGCSRTDKGVHAMGYVLNFFTNSKIPAHGIKYALNNKLPRDIVVLDAQEADEEFHARYSSIGKTYVYTILNREIPPAIGKNYVFHYKYKLNIELMKEGAKYLIGTHDFEAFKNKGGSVKTSVRTVKEIKIEKEHEYIKIYITADGFLYNMARIIVGTLVNVGGGIIIPEKVKEIIESKDRQKAGKTAPPQGLSLLKVYY